MEMEMADTLLVNNTNLELVAPLRIKEISDLNEDIQRKDEGT